MNWNIKDIIGINGLLLLIFFPVVCCGQPNGASACQGLTTAASTYLKNAFGKSLSLTWSSRNGEDLKICTPPSPQQISCCSDEHEKKFKENAIKFITRFSQKTLSEDINTEYTKLSAQVRKLLEQTKEKILFRINSTYRVPEKYYYPSLTALVANLTSFLSPTSSFEPQSTSPVPKFIETFFLDFFPPIFMFHFGSFSSDPSDKAIECIKKQYKTLSPIPFHNIPSEYGKKIGDVLLAFRTLLGSLQVATNLLNRTLTAGVSDNCLNGLIKLRLCHLCNGQNVSLPCSNTCLNIHRGCFAHLLPLRSGWTELVKVIKRVVDVITNNYNLMDKLKQLDNTVLKSVSHATHTLATYTNQIVRACVSSALDSSNKSSVSNVSVSKMPSQNVNIHDDYLQPRLNVIRSLLTNNQLFFDHLPDQYCKGLRSQQCWNGTHQSPIGYSRSLLKFTTSAQPVNPEVQMKAPETFSITEVENENMKLLQLAKGLTNLVNNKLAPQSSWKTTTGLEGSGFNSPTALPVDDEENTRGDPRRLESSGSGQGPVLRDGSEEQAVRQITSSKTIGDTGNRENSVSNSPAPQLGFFSAVILFFLTNHFLVT